MKNAPSTVVISILVSIFWTLAPLLPTTKAAELFFLSENPGLPAFVNPNEVVVDEQPSWYRSPGLALTLSLGTSLIPVGIGAAMIASKDNNTVQNVGWGLLATGALLGPSSGHMYTGNWGRVAAFTGGRIGCVGIVAFGVMLSFAPGGDNPQGDDKTAANKILATGAVVGASLYLGLTIWEYVDTYYSAERHNQEHQKSLALSPMILPPPVGAKPNTPVALGLGLSGRF